MIYRYKTISYQNHVTYCKNNDDDCFYASFSYFYFKENASRKTDAASTFVHKFNLSENGNSSVFNFRVDEKMKEGAGVKFICNNHVHTVHKKQHATIKLRDARTVIATVIETESIQTCKFIS